MRLFVSGATATLRRHPDRDRLGVLLVPAAGNSPRTALDLGLPWAADNAAFSGFDPTAFCALLGRIGGYGGCRFVACPDVVGDAAATLLRFSEWAPVVRAVGLPVALVAQDGLERHSVPWDDIDALFVGGSTDWKLGAPAAALVREAKCHGLWVHMGRVNTRLRMRHAHEIGCDSVDGSGFSRWPEQRVPAGLRWLADLDGGTRPDRGVGAADLFRGGDPFAARGWQVVRATRSASGYEIALQAPPRVTECPKCGHRHHRPDYRHGSRPLTVWDVPRNGLPVRLVFRRRRLRCRVCRRVYPVSPTGVLDTCPLTREAAEWLSEAGRERRPSDAAERMGVTTKTIRSWQRRLTGLAETARPDGTW